MNGRCIVTAMALACFALAAGCARPLTPYEKGRALIDESHASLWSGDEAMAAKRPNQAARLYAKGADEADRAVAYFADGEQKIEADIRTADEQRRQVGYSAAPSERTAVNIGTRNVEVDRFYADSLRAYRESLALAVVMRSLALARDGEAHYRQGAQGILDGDAFYRANQFAAAQKKYQWAESEMRAALGLFGSASGFIDAQMVRSSRLAEASPPSTWGAVKQVQVLAARRREQADAYLAATVERSSKAGYMVAAYKERSPGNVPPVKPQALSPLDPILRYGVAHPPIPGTRPTAAAPVTP